jgi:excisionase family DNA binding protein
MMPTNLAELLQAAPSSADGVSDRDFIESAYREFVVRRSPGEFRQQATVAPERTLTTGELRALRRVGLATDEHTQRDAEQARKASLHAWFHLFRSALSTTQAAELLAVHVSRIRQRIKERTLLALEDGGELRVPALQFEDSMEVPGLRKVLPVVPIEVKPLDVLSWFATPTAELEDTDGRPRSPREFLLETGDVEPVIVLAKALGSGEAA